MHICGNYKQYYPLSVVYTPPLYNSKQAGKLESTSGSFEPETISKCKLRCCHLLKANSPTKNDLRPLV